jgi:hypothetical protein
MLMPTEGERNIYITLTTQLFILNNIGRWLWHHIPHSATHTNIGYYSKLNYRTTNGQIPCLQVS